MNLLPYEAYTIETPQSPDAVAVCLLGQLRPKSWTNRWSAGLPYEGTVEPYHFQINRVVGWYTKARPVIISGAVQPTGTGSRIQITLRPDGTQLLSLVLVFTLWPAFVLWRFSALAGYLPMFLLLAYLSVSLSFQWEARKAKQFLSTALAAPPPVAAAAPAPYSAFTPPTPTQHLPGTWAADPAAPPRYDWQATPSPFADGAEHETQRLPPVVW